MKRITVLVFCMLAAVSSVWAGGAVEAEEDLQKKITVQSWQFATGEAENQGQVLTKAFEQDYSSISAEPVFYQYTDHFTNLRLDLASGEGPDVFGLQVGAPLKEFSEFILPIEDFARRDLGEDWREILTEASMAQINLFNSDEAYALPSAMSYAGAMWVNRTLLNSYKLDIPETWDELVQVTRVLRENDEIPLLVGAGDDWINLDIFMVIANDLSRENLYEAIEGNRPWTADTLVKSFDYWQQLFSEQIVQKGALGLNMYMESNEIWVDGRAPLHVNGSWEMGIFNPEAGLQNYDEFMSYDRTVVRFPDVNGDGVPAPVVSAPDVIWAINKNTDSPEAAWDFIRYIVFEEGQQEMVDRLAFFPAKIGVTPSVDLTPKLEELTSQFIAFGEDAGGYREIPYPRVREELARQLQLLAAEQTSPQQAAQAMEKISKEATR